MKRFKAQPKAEVGVLLALVALGLLIRLAAIAATHDYRPAFDAADFDRHARSIADGHGYPRSLLAADGGPTAFRPPLYPCFLGAAYRIAGDSQLSGRIATALVGTLVVLLLYLVGDRLWGRRVGLIAAAIGAVAPPLVQWNAVLLTEPVFQALTLGLVLALLAVRRSDRALAWAVAAGALCGLAALTRSNGLVLLIPALVGAWIGRPASGLRALREPAAVVLGALVIMAPWAIRNTVQLHEFVPLNTQSGYGLAGTYNDAARHDAQYPASWFAPQFQGPSRGVFRQHGLNEAEVDDELNKAAKDYAQDNPGYVVKVLAVNTLRLLDFVPSRGQLSFEAGRAGYGARTVDFLRACAYALLLAALVGIAVLLRRYPRGRRGPVFFWLIPALATLAAVPVAGGPRYLAPAQPFFVLLAAIAVAGLWRERRTPVRAGGRREASGVA